MSSAGFQRGAIDAAAHTNIQVLDWRQFQEMFVDPWFHRHMTARLHEDASPLIE